MMPFSSAPRRTPSPLPPHNGQTTSIPAENNTPNVAPPPPPSHITIRVPPTPRQASTSGTPSLPHNKQTTSIYAEYNTPSVALPSSSRHVGIYHPPSPWPAAPLPPWPAAPLPPWPAAPLPPWPAAPLPPWPAAPLPPWPAAPPPPWLAPHPPWLAPHPPWLAPHPPWLAPPPPWLALPPHTSPAVPPPTWPAVLPPPWSAAPSPEPIHVIPSRTSSPIHVAKVVIDDSFSFDVDFSPAVPKYISRYHGDNLQVANSTECHEIPALMRSFPNNSLLWLNDVPDWQSYVHPDGALYLYNETRRTFTEAKGITSSHKLRLVNECMNALNRPPMCPSSVDLRDNDIELVLQLNESTDGHVVCKYYFVDHAKRTLFWLHKYIKATDHVFDGMRGVHDPSHIAHALEYQYWLHCDTYPNHKHVRAKLLEELRNIVIFSRADMIMAENSLSPYSADDLSNILKLIDHLKVNTEKNDSPHCICVIARFMKSFSHSKFLNFHGQPYARPDADTSVFKENTHYSYPSLILNVMLFWAQQAHYDQLQRVWVDKTVIKRRWKFFSSNLTEEWKGITIYSTVMLVVDVTFLAVPNMNIQQSHSIGVIAIYVSTTFTTGSLIISLLLLRHIQSYGPNSFHAVAIFLTNTTRTRFRMRALATIYSLPYAMLLWGMIFFSVAFLYNVFKSTTIAMLVSVIGGCTVVSIFILLFLWTASEVGIIRRLARLVKCFRRPAKLLKDVGLEAGIPDDTQDFKVLADSEERYPHPHLRSQSIYRPRLRSQTIYRPRDQTQTMRQVHSQSHALFSSVT